MPSMDGEREDIMSLFETRKDYSIVKDYVQYVKKAEQIAAKEDELKNLKKDLGEDSPFVIVATANLDKARKDAEDVLARKDAYDKLSEGDKDLITLAMGRFTDKLEASEEFLKEVANCIERLQKNTVDANTVKRLCKVAGDVLGVKVKPYRDANETILEGFKSCRYTGLRLGKYEPVKFAKRSAKQWEVQLALYLYASLQG